MCADVCISVRGEKIIGEWMYRMHRRGTTWSPVEHLDTDSEVVKELKHLLDAMLKYVPRERLPMKEVEGKLKALLQKVSLSFIFVSKI